MLGDRLFHLLLIICLSISVAFMAGCVQEEYDLEIQAYPEEAGEIEGEGTYEEGEEVTVEVEPEEGYEFLKWEIDGEEITSDKDYKLEVSEDITIEAQFEKQEYQVSLSVPLDKGKVGFGEIRDTDYEETYKYGEEVTVEAKPSDYFEFDYWEDLEGDKGSEDKSYTFQVEGDHDLVANFKPNLEEVIELSDGGSRKDIEPIVSYGIEITLGDVWEQLIAHTSDHHDELQSYLNRVEVRETNKENKKSVHFGTGGLYRSSVVGYVDTKTSDINLIGSAGRFDKVELYWSPDEDYIVYDYGDPYIASSHLYVYNVQEDELIEINQKDGEKKFKEKYEEKAPTKIHNLKWSEEGTEIYFDIEEIADEKIISWKFDVEEKELTLDQ